MAREVQQSIPLQTPRALGERECPLDQPLLVVLDGAKGLRAAVRLLEQPLQGNVARTKFAAA